MRGPILALLATAAAIALAWWVAGLNGAVDVTLLGLDIRTTTPVAILALVVLVFALAVVIRVVIWLLAVPRGIGAWRQRRRRDAGDHAISRTLVALAANDAAEAHREARRARRLLGDTPQTLLHAAEAARLAGHEAEAAALFELLCAHEEGRFLGLRGLFRQAIAREDWVEAQRLASEAEQIQPGQSWLREERTQLAVRLGNWAQALSLAGPDTPKNALAVAAARAEPDDSRALRLAKRTYRENRGFAPAALAYATRLRAAGRGRRAQETLREAWAAAPNPDLAELYLAPVSDPLQRVREATLLTQANPRHPESQFLLARLTFAAGQLPEARKHAEAARDLGLDQPRLWTLLADIAKAEFGDTEQGRAVQGEVMRQVKRIEPDPGWACENCGTPQTAWAPVCPTCHATGRIMWGIKARSLVAGPQAGSLSPS